MIIERLEARRLLSSAVTGLLAAPVQQGSPAVLSDPPITTLALPAQPPNLDQSFGVGGVATINAYNVDSATSVVIQGDGKVVVAGWTGPTPASNMDAFTADSITLVRLNSDGTLDSTFGTGGKARFEITNLFNQPTALQRQPLPLVLLDDGSFLVGGNGVRKVSSTGQLLNAFGDDRSGRVDGMAVTPAGKIITVNDIFRFSQFNADGTLDSTFGNNGFVSLSDGIAIPGIGIPDSHDLIVQADGKILTIGTGSQNGVTQLVLTRQNTNGTLDTTFGTGGAVFTSGLEGWSIALTSDNKILAAGFGASGITLARYLASNGALDTAFGTAGLAKSGLSQDERPTKVILDADGKILTASNGSNFSSGAGKMTIHRFTAAGALDTTFGSNGTSSVDMTIGNNPLFQVASDLVLQSDGKIVGVGKLQLEQAAPFEYSTYESAADFYVFRLNPTASPPPDAAISRFGVLTVNNLTSAADTITLDQNNGQARLNRNGTITTYALADVKGFSLNTFGGNDTITCALDIPVTLDSGDGNDTVITAGGRDFLTTGAGDDSITSAAGDDTILSGDGVDTISSGDGDDSVITDGSVESAIGAQIDAGAGNDRVVSTFAGTISAGDGDDHVIVFASNQIDTGDGNDVVTAIVYAGRIDSGAGDDLVRCNSSAAHPALVFAGDGRDSIYTSDGSDSIYGGAGRDIVHAGNGSDLISGGGGNDVLFGQGGKDRLYGGAGDDRLEGQSGNDRLTGGSGTDTVNGGPGTDSADRSDALDLLISIENDLV